MGTRAYPLHTPCDISSVNTKPLLNEPHGPPWSRSNISLAAMHDDGHPAACSADEVISTEDEDIVERVAAITGNKGAYAAFDAVGGGTLEQVRWPSCAAPRLSHAWSVTDASILVENPSRHEAMRCSVLFGGWKPAA